MAQHVKAARQLAREIKGGNPIRASLLLALILVLMGSAFAWAALTELDAVTRAQGRVVPSAEVQVVQASEPSVIARIHVKEGDLVDKDAVLVTLDESQIKGELTQAQRRVQALRLRIARLRAEIAEEQFDVAPETAAEMPDLVASERALFEARHSAREDEIAVLERQRHQRQQEVLEAESRLQTADASLELINEEVRLIEPLVDNGVEARTTLISLMGRRSEATGRQVEARAQLVRSRAAVSEVRDRIVSVRSSARAESLDLLARAEAELAEVRVMLPALETRLTRSELLAPVSGIVNRVLMTTVGGLARAGDPLVEIVPIEDELLIEAYLPPKDVAFVRPSQDVRVSITAYDTSRYGSLDGNILRVGADAVTRPERDDSVFIVEIRTEGALTDAAGQPVSIVPGMVAQVDILSGKRTVLEYLTAPIVRVKELALRE